MVMVGGANLRSVVMLMVAATSPSPSSVGSLEKHPARTTTMAAQRILFTNGHLACHSGLAVWYAEVLVVADNRKCVCEHVARFEVAGVERSRTIWHGDGARV